LYLFKSSGKFELERKPISRISTLPTGILGDQHHTQHTLQLTSNIPSQLGSLGDKLTLQLRLDNNLFSGTIPSEMGTFSNLVNIVNVPSNILSGSIPSELGGLISLTGSFYLHSNRYCDEVPVEVIALSSQVAQYDVLSDNMCVYYEALSQLYTSTGGSSWTSKVRWMENTGINPCLGLESWYGITCSASDNRIVKLLLAQNNLVGTLPSQLGLLSHLTNSLYLYTNSLSGMLPSQLGQLTGLTTGLRVYSTQLTGRIPSQLGLLTLMKSFFQLYSSSLSGSIPSELGQLTALSSYLYFQTNLLTQEVFPLNLVEFH
jgi:hypothetical protein